MNFGQHWRTAGITDVGYCASLPLTFVADFLLVELPAFVEDAIAFPSDDELERQLRAHDFPGAQQILRDPMLSSPVVRYFVHELLLRWLGDGPPSRAPGFVVNTADNVSICDSFAVISGTARQDDSPVMYQDT